MRKSIEVQGARQNNLQDISLDIPRDEITVITGVSGSGRSSLAFDVVFGEGQRRFLDSLSTYAKSRVAQVKKPDVDFVFGLSPVIAIEQKKGLVNPRSTVGTMTDVYDYLRLLYATVGEAQCPLCGHGIEMKSIHQIAERIMSLPEGTEVGLLAPVERIYNEDYAYLFDEIRKHGYRHILLDGKPRDLGDQIELDEFDDHEVIVVADRFIVHPERRKSLVHALETVIKTVGEGFVRIDVPTLLPDQ